MERVGLKIKRNKANQEQRRLKMRHRGKYFLTQLIGNSHFGDSLGIRYYPVMAVRTISTRTRQGGVDFCSQRKIGRII